MRQILSLGAGVQSSTLALLAKHGIVGPMPELAIFADTGWEPRAVYDWLAWLEQQLPFPVVRVQKGNIRADQVDASAKRRASLPYFVDSGGGRGGIVPRQCTAEYKIEPVELYMRRNVLGLAARQRAPREAVIDQWRGISADEAYRLKPSREPWFRVRYPLALELGWSRHDCLQWMQRQGYPRPPRSACLGCPYHSNDEWRRIRDETPDEWQDAVEFDAAIRKAGGMRGDAYLHRSLKPLDQAPIDDDSPQMDLWGEECAGMCGT